MAVGPATTFERLLAGLGNQQFAAFVADLWRASGQAVRVEDASRVVIEGDGGEERVLRPVHWRFGPVLRLCLARGRIELGAADVLVTSRHHDRLEARARDAGMEYVGPSVLRDRLLYGVERDQAAALFQDYFDRPIAAVADVGRTAGTGATEATGQHLPGFGGASRGSRGAIPTVITLGLLVVISTTLFVGLGATPLLDPSGGSTSDPGSAASSGTDSGTGTTEPAATEQESVNLQAILDRHRAALGDRSVTLAASHEHTRGALLTDQRWEDATLTVQVGPGSQYAIAVAGTLPPTVGGSHARAVAFDVRGNDSTCGARGQWTGLGLGDRDPCAVVTNRSGAGAAVELTTAALTRYLAGTDPVLRPREAAAGAAFEIRSSHAPPVFNGRPNTYRAVGIVDRTGVITELRVSYETPLVPGRQPVHFEYAVENWTGVGTTPPAPTD